MISVRKKQIYIYSSIESVHIIGISGTLTDGEILPGFQLPMTEIFQRVPCGD